MGIYMSACALAIGFAVVWQIVWLIAAGVAGAIVCIVVRALDEDTEYKIPAAEVAKIESARTPYYLSSQHYE